MEINYKQIARNCINVRNIHELITTSIGVIAVAILLFCTYHFSWWSWLQYVWIGLFAITIISAIWTLTVSSPLFYKKFRYAISDDFLYIKSGVWTISEVIVPMAKIQSIELTQGVIMRKYGVSSVQMTTMNGDHSIPYVDEFVAKQLRDDIAKLARLKELDA